MNPQVVEIGIDPASNHSESSSRYGNSVRFAASPHVVLVPSLSDMSDDEVEALWHTDEDTRRIETDMVDSIKAHRRNALNEVEHTLRGLEHMKSSTELRARKHGKESAVRAVLEEQSCQRQMGKFDREALRAASVSVTRGAKTRALSDAAADSAFVRQHIAPNKPKLQKQNSVSRGVLLRLNTHPPAKCANRNASQIDEECLSVLGRALDISQGRSPRRIESSPTEEEITRTSRIQALNNMLDRISSSLQSEAEASTPQGESSAPGLRDIMLQASRPTRSSDMKRTQQ